MKKIKYVSLFFRLFFQITFVCLLSAQFIGWMEAPQSGGFFNVIPASYQYLIQHQIAASTKFAGFFVSSIPLIIKLSVLYFLIKLFNLYANYEFFSVRNVFYIRYAGYALLFFELVKPLTD